MENDAMPTYLPCPGCHTLLRPPTRASNQAILRCPLCQHELEAYDLVKGLQRQWLVIEDRGTDDFVGKILTGQTKAQVADALSSAETASADSPIGVGGISNEPEAEGGTGGGAGSQLGTGPQGVDAAKINWDRLRPATQDDFIRKIQEKRSPLISALQVIAGGLAAIPVGLLLVWHVLGKDVAGAGPTVGRVLPWVVPAKFRKVAILNPTDRQDGGEVNRSDFDDGLRKKFDPPLTEKPPENDTPSSTTASRPSGTPSTSKLDPVAPSTDTSSKAADRTATSDGVLTNSDGRSQLSVNMNRWLEALTLLSQATAGGSEAIDPAKLAVDPQVVRLSKAISETTMRLGETNSSALSNRAWRERLHWLMSVSTELPAFRMAFEQTKLEPAKPGTPWVGILPLLDLSSTIPEQFNTDGSALQGKAPLVLEGTSIRLVWDPRWVDPNQIELLSNRPQRCMMLGVFQGSEQDQDMASDTLKVVGVFLIPEIGDVPDASAPDTDSKKDEGSSP
jgi:hypothetical protein